MSCWLVRLLLDDVIRDKVKRLGLGNCVDVGDLVAICDAVELIFYLKKYFKIV